MRVHPISEEKGGNAEDMENSPTHSELDSPTLELGSLNPKYKHINSHDRGRSSPNSSIQSFDTNTSKHTPTPTKLLKTKVETTAVRDAEKKINDIQERLASLGSTVVNQVT